MEVPEEYLHSASSDESDGASDSVGSTSAPVVSSVGSVAGGGTVEDIIEADLRAAAAALHRPLRSRVDDAAASRKSTDAAAPPHLTISDTRRAEILAKLASERTERRGFASAREQQLSERSSEAAAAAVPASSAAQPKSDSSVLEAVHRATNAAVNDAISRAFASAGVTLSTSSSTGSALAASKATASHHDAASVSNGGISFSSTAADPALTAPINSNMSDRDRLVTRLLAERRAKLSASAASMKDGSLLGAAGGSAAAFSSSTNSRAVPHAIDAATSGAPPPPPLVARALEARAASQKARSPASALIPPPPPPPPAESYASTLANSGLGNDDVLIALRAQVAERMRARNGGSAASSRGVKFASPEAAVAAPVIARRSVAEPQSSAAEAIPPQFDSISPKVRASSTGSGSSSYGRFKRPSEEAIRAEREAALYGECTFKPRLVSGRSSSEKASREQENAKVANALRIEALARDQSQVYAQRERLKMEAEASRVASECTFQPKVRERSRSSSRLHEADIEPEPPASSYGESRARAYLEGNVAPDAAVAGTAPSDVPRAASASAAAASNRLYLEADRRALKAAQAKAAVERQALAQFTFTPTINATSAAIVASREAGGSSATAVENAPSSYRPIYERSEEVQRNAADALHRLRMETLVAGPAAECTFQPRINPQSARIAAVSRGRGGAADILPRGGDAPRAAQKSSITDRLIREAADAEARKVARRLASAQEEANACTFKPRISQSTEGYVRTQLARLDGKGNTPAASALAAHDTLAHPESSAPAADPMSRFILRQAAMLEAKKRNLAAIESEMRAEAACTFKPDIGNADEVLTLTRPERMLEATDTLVERLGKQDVSRKNADLDKRREEHFSQFTFKPEINAESRARGRAHTVEELKNNDRGARARLKAAAIVEADFIAKHPFHPVLVATDAPPSPGGGARAAVAARICVTSDPERVSEQVADVLAAAEAKRELARKRAEFDELKSCTFVPETHVSKVSLAKLKQAAEIDGGVVIVRGLGRHLELKELSRHIEEEKRDREIAAFSVKGVVPWNEHRGPTVPQPFHLATSDRAADDRHAGHVGKPDARPAAQRALLEKLLEEDARAGVNETFGATNIIDITRA